MSQSHGHSSSNENIASTAAACLHIAVVLGGYRVGLVSCLGGVVLGQGPTSPKQTGKPMLTLVNWTENPRPSRSGFRMPWVVSTDAGSVEN